MGIAMAMVPILFIPLMLFGGFFLNTNNIPVWIFWLKYFSLFKYGFEIAVLNEFKGLHFTCAQSEQVGGHCQYDSKLSHSLFSLLFSSFSLILFSFSSLLFFLSLSRELYLFTLLYLFFYPSIAGDDVISALAMDNAQTNIWSGFLFLLMQYLLFRLVAYVSLRFTAGRKKG